LIRVAYAALQGGDLPSRRGTLPPGEAQHVVGYQAAGVIEAVGAEVVGLRPGDRVAGFAFAGSHAELFAVEGNHAYPVPDGLDLSVAAAVPVEFGTAHDGLFEYDRLKPGKTVLVWGARPRSSVSRSCCRRALLCSGSCSAKKWVRRVPAPPSSSRS
jgi:NADPH2:quinone reductase